MGTYKNVLILIWRPLDVSVDDSVLFPFVLVKLVQRYSNVFVAMYAISFMDVGSVVQVVNPNVINILVDRSFISYLIGL